ncbi:MAG: hypothetical protein QOG08_1789 [Chloroflexota bacterium]|nr:hypothetical protein [Chloroflexota bacterium]
MLPSAKVPPNGFVAWWLRLAVVAAFVLGSTTLAANAATSSFIYVPMTSSPNPSVYGQVVVFKIRTGTLCALGGHLVLSENGNFIGIASMPKAPSVFAYFETSHLSVGKHQINAWSDQGCFTELNNLVTVVGTDLMQIVKAKPKPPPVVFRPPSPSPVSRPVAARSPRPSPSPSPTPVPTPSPEPVALLQEGSAPPNPGAPATPGGLAAAAISIVIFGVLAGAAYRWRRLRARP